MWSSTSRHQLRSNRRKRIGLSDLSELPEAGSVAAAVESLTEQAGPDEAGEDAETADVAAGGAEPGAEAPEA